MYSASPILPVPKLIKINDQAENAKEIIVLLRTLHELYKNIKKRANDIGSLKNIRNGNIFLPKDQLIDDTFAKLQAAEYARIKTEEKKISIIETFSVEEKEIKKQIIKKLKKTVRTFDKLTSNLSKKSLLKLKKTLIFTNEDMLNQIMCVPENNEENITISQDSKDSLPQDTVKNQQKPKIKPPICKNRSLAMVLKFCFHEQILDLKFICLAISMFSRIDFQKAILKTQKATLKLSKLRPKKTFGKTNCSEESKVYNKLVMDKIYAVLLENNESALTDVQEYRKNYFKRHPSPQKNNKNTRSQQK